MDNNANNHPNNYPIILQLNIPNEHTIYRPARQASKFALLKGLLIIGCVCMIIYYLNGAFVNTEVDHGGLRNIALYKPAKLSSVYRNNEASYGVDGDLNTVAHAHLYNSIDAIGQLTSIMSWEVDFQGLFLFIRSQVVLCL